MGRFSIDISEIADELPLVPAGLYPGRIVTGETRSGTSESGVNWANFSVAIAINDPDVAKAMGIDEPRVFFGGMFSFDDDGKFQDHRTPMLGNFIKAVEFTNTSDFENEKTEEAESEKEYILALTESIMAAAIGTDVMTKVTHQAKSKKDSTLVSRATKLAPIN